LIALYSGRRAAEIAEIDADAVFAQLGLFDHLSPTRHVGVYAMVEHIKRIAAAAGDGLDTAVRAPGAAGGHPTVLRSA
ncbi:MAG: SufE family protein, partial [Gammaproteobacteria bacterium]|nr:SufE family protein [Gammaproteobacteria bacterium]